MIKTKTKRLIFASLFFLFLGFSSVLAANDPFGELILPGGNEEVVLPGTTTTTTTEEIVNTETKISDTDKKGGADYETAPKTGTTETTTTTSSGGSSSGTGLVQCGNEGGTACTFNDLFTTMIRVIDYVFNYVVPFLAILGIVMAAITMMTSNGDPGKFAQGRTAIIAIGIGLIIVYLSWTIVKSFIEFLGGQSWTTQFFK